MLNRIGSQLDWTLQKTVAKAMIGSVARYAPSSVGEVLVTQGIHSNEAVRQAGAVRFLFNLAIALVAVLSIVKTVPKGRKYNDD